MDATNPNVTKRTDGTSKPGVASADGAAGGEALGQRRDSAQGRKPAMTMVNFRAKGQDRKLKMPTMSQLLAETFPERRYLLSPWLREQESSMVYAASGVGKSWFALSAALAVAGGGEFLGWKPDAPKETKGWRVLYIDGEMHAADIQERIRMLHGAGLKINHEMAGANLSLLARQHQDHADFPLITEPDGRAFVLTRIKKGKHALVVLDNFSTLGEVEDENAAASFNSIQAFLLGLKTQGVATMLVHHANKTGEDFRGSSKLAATFETIVKLERPAARTDKGTAAFRVRFDKVRAGGPKRYVREVVTQLATDDDGQTVWQYEMADLERYDQLGAALAGGEFTMKKEIADYFDVSETMAGKYIRRGIELGIWTKRDVGVGLAEGKKRRALGHSKAPVRPDDSWEKEAAEEGAAEDESPF